jgi:hypothetical protein
MWPLGLLFFVCLVFRSSHDLLFNKSFFVCNEYKLKTRRVEQEFTFTQMLMMCKSPITGNVLTLNMSHHFICPTGGISSIRTVLVKYKVEKVVTNTLRFKVSAGFS